MRKQKVTIRNQNNDDNENLSKSNIAILNNKRKDSTYQQKTSGVFSIYGMCPTNVNIHNKMKFTRKVIKTCR